MSTETQKFTTLKSAVGWTGFFVLGTLLGAMGPLLVVWNFFLDTEPARIGERFLGFGVGCALAYIPWVRNLFRRGAWVGPLPLLAGWTASDVTVLGGVVLLGLGFGGLVQSVLQSEPERCGSAGRVEWPLRMGVIAAAVIYWTAYQINRPMETKWAMAALAVLVLLFNLLGGRSRTSVEKLASRAPEQRGLATALLGGLVFLVSGCEWGLAWWLPIYSMRTLGSSPERAICCEALLVALTFGFRCIAEVWLRRNERRRVLLAGFVLASAGYLVLSGQSSPFEEYTGVVMVASGIAPLYTMTKNILDERFAFEPDLYSHLSLSGFLGALLFAGAMAWMAEWFGVRAIPLLPLAGLSGVVILQLLLMFEKRLMGSNALVS